MIHIIELNVTIRDFSDYREGNVEPGRLSHSSAWELKSFAR